MTPNFHRLSCITYCHNKKLPNNVQVKIIDRLQILPLLGINWTFIGSYMHTAHNKFKFVFIPVSQFPVIEDSSDLSVYCTCTLQTIHLLHVLHFTFSCKKS